MKSKKYILCALVMSLSLVACSSANVTYERYSLTQDVCAEALTSNYNVKVYLQDFLNVGGVVIQTNSMTVQESVKRRWISSLDNQLAILFKDILVKNKANNKNKYELYVSKFHGTYDGEVLVSFFVKIYDSKGKLIKERAFDSKSTIAKDGYDSLVRSLHDDFVKESNKLF